jgi:Glyoxalase/Bleomycin resistance protein/Dioxygenase superfamily
MSVPGRRRDDAVLNRVAHLAGFGPPVQIAYSVADVDDAAALWQSRFGAGPFVLRRHIELSNVRISGAPGTFDHSSAYGQWGDIMVELVQQHTPAIGAPIGIHHCAYFVEDLDGAQRALIDAGFPELLWAQVAGSSTAFAYHDARPTLGHLIEVYVGTPRLREFYVHIRSLAVTAAAT